MKAICQTIMQLFNALSKRMESKPMASAVLGSPSEILQFCELAGVEGIFVEELTFSRD